MKISTMTVGLLLALASANVAAEWTTCAQEGGLCTFQGRRDVYFGAGNQWLKRTYSDGVKCSSQSFGGDPTPGVAKTCRIEVAAGAPVAQWSTCAKEGAMCMIDGRKEVSFGVGNKWITTIFASNVKCTTDSFMGDPAVGTPKSCRVRNLMGGTTPRWVRCANEGQVCKFTGDRNVSFGAGNRVKYRGFRNGVVCNTKNFGDPAPGSAKACYYDAG